MPAPSLTGLTSCMKSYPDLYRTSYLEFITIQMPPLPITSPPNPGVNPWWGQGGHGFPSKSDG